MEMSNAVENRFNATNPSSTTKSPVPGSGNRSRSGKAKLSKLDEEIAKVSQQLTDLAAQRREIARVEEAKEKERQEKMEKSVNQHLAILARLSGVDFRASDGKLNSRHNNLNEALIAGCFARMKMEVGTRPGFAAQLEEEGQVVLADRAKKGGKNIRPTPKSTSTS